MGMRGLVATSAFVLKPFRDKEGGGVNSCFTVRDMGLVGDWMGGSVDILVGYEWPYSYTTA